MDISRVLTKELQTLSTRMRKEISLADTRTLKKQYDVILDDSRKLSIQLVHQPGDGNKDYLFTHTDPSVRIEFNYNENQTRLFSALDLLIRKIPKNFEIQDRALDKGGFVIERDGDIRLVMDNHGKTELETTYSNGNWVRVGGR